MYKIFLFKWWLFTIFLPHFINRILTMFFLMSFKISLCQIQRVKTNKISMNVFISLALWIFGAIKQLTFKLSMYLLNSLKYIGRSPILISAFSLKILELRCSSLREIAHLDVGEDFWFCLPSSYLGNHTLGSELHCWVWACTMETKQENSPVWLHMTETVGERGGRKLGICICSFIIAVLSQCKNLS